MKTVLILSGGMDSTTLLYDLKARGHEVKALSFDYGQKHKKELDYAARSCSRLGIEHRIVDLTVITPLISNSSLTGDEEIPEGHYEDETMKSTVVPNRNAIMLSIAVGWAENEEYDCVSIANHGGDHAIYPDCRSEFIAAINLAAQLGTYNKIQIHAPYSNISKTDIAEKGLLLDIPFDDVTWSCYVGKEEPCGKCGTCVERIEALRDAALRL